MTAHPIFLHSLFRTGSTYIWNKFRQNPSYYCYYEPFHQCLADLTAENIETALTNDFESVNHPVLTRCYLHEYKPLLNPGQVGLPFFKKSFSFDEFCYKDQENPDLKRYIDNLVSGAGEKIPLLQFNRSALRVKWFKRFYPDSLNIYLVRNPSDQWASYFEVARKAHDIIFFAMDLVTAGVNCHIEDFQPLAARIPLFEFHFDRFSHELNIYRLIEPLYPLEEKYAIFYYIWLKALLENLLNADFLLDMNRLSSDAEYREEFENLIYRYSGAEVDFRDAAVRTYTEFPLTREKMTTIENDLQQIIVSALDNSQRVQLAKKLEKENNYRLPVPLPEPATSEFLKKEIPHVPPISRMNRDKFKQAVILLTEKNSDLQLKWQRSQAANEAKKRAIYCLEQQFEWAQSELKQSLERENQLEIQLQEYKNILERVRSSLSWRITSPLRGIHNRLKPSTREKNTGLNAKRKIAIDVTPVLPGGDNGGIKLLVWELLKRFQHAENEEFILLTAAKNDHLFNEFKMKRICVLNNSSSTTASSLKTRLVNVVKKRLKRKTRKRILKENNVTVLFCPFAAPTFVEPGIAAVSVIADLQHLYYPYFFSKNELKNRNQFYERIQARVDDIIAISEYTRQTVIEKLGFPPERVYALPVSLHSTHPLPPAAAIRTILEKHNLREKTYCLYPANFWPHKNHKIVITAFAMFSKQYPAYDLHIVFTGEPVGNHAILKDSVRRMGIESRVHFTGFLPEEELAVIWSEAYFLIYPSLFEGFGIPLIEAMSYGKPVLASNTTSIPEVAGDAALYFDPRKPDEIVDALRRIMEDNSLYTLLVNKGQEQLKKYNFDEMVNRYLDVLEEAANQNRSAATVAPLNRRREN